MQLRRFIVFIVILGVHISSLAWDATGHRVIATIAYQHLSAHARQQVNYLTLQLFHYGSNYQRFLHAATWPDDIHRQQVTLFKTWHYINLPWSSDGSPTTAYADSNLVVALQQSMLIVANKRINTNLRAVMLSMLIHLLGDAEQPLHCINHFSKQFPHGDAGGNLYPISAQGVDNLHEFWDGGLGLFMPPHSSYKDYINYINRLSEQFTQQFPASQFEPELNDMQVQHWVLKSYQQAIKTVYTINGSEPSAYYIRHGQQLVASQAALGGYRLAIILNKLFDTTESS